MTRLLESSSERQRRLDALQTQPIARLVFVCHGNIMRSAFAVSYLRAQMPSEAARILGAGTHATDGRPAQESALNVAPTFGVDLSAHRAQSLEAVGLQAHDVVVCMDRANEANVATRFQQVAARVFLIGDVAPGDAASREVADPYGLGDVATERAFRAVIDRASRWGLSLATGAPAAGCRPSWRILRDAKS